VASGANFDAEIRLDIGPFIASIKRAQGEVAKLSQQIDSLNKKTVAPRVAVAGGNAQLGAASTSVGAGSQQRMAAAREEISVIKDIDEAEKKRNKNAQSNLARERYALYDVAAAYTMIAGGAALAVGVTAKTAIDFERAFANVARTTDFVSIKIGEAADSMRSSLQALADEIPVTFGEITQIATIGNQLGIAQGALVAFTDTVAKFSSTTGVSVEQTAMAFGRIGELLGVAPENFESLGSSIAFAGVNAVATEEQILSVTKEIATTAKMAKFSTAEIVGLSTALSSLGIAPEAARGSIIRTFAGINAAISEGGDRLNSYAQIAGMSAAEFSKQWQDNGQIAFDSFLEGLQAMSAGGQNLDTVLRDIGMKNVRDIQTIQKLGDNYQVYADSIRDANKGFDEATFLGEAYSKIQDTLAARLQVLQNNFANLFASLGEGSTQFSIFGFGLKEAVTVLGDLVKGLDNFAKSPLGSFIVGVLTLLTALTAAIAAVNAVAALSRASMLAFATSMGIAKVSADGAKVSINKLTLAATIFSTALKAVGWIAAISAITGALALLAEAFTPVQQRADNLIGGFAGLQEALGADYTAALARFGSDTAVGMAIASNAIQGATVSVDSNEEAVRKAAEQQEGLAYISGGALADGIETATNKIDSQNVVLGENFDAWIKTRIASSEAFQNFAADKSAMDTLKEIKFNIQDALDVAKSGGSVTQYIIDLGNAALNSGKLSEAAATKLIAMLAAARVASGGIYDIANLLEGSVAEGYLLGGIMPDVADGTEDAATEAERLQKELKGSARALRTVVDYANDLRGVFSRAFEIRFGSRESLDQIASGWNNIANKAENAADAIKTANAEIAELAADRSILAYQLTVAERYGDEQRAAVIRAKIAKIDGNIANKKEEISDATAELTKSTDGNTDSAIENRNVLRDQVQSYASYIEMLSKTGVKGKELRDRVKELKEEFKKNATEAGFSNEALKPYLKTFDDMGKVIKETPRNVDIEFKSNISAAQQSLNEYLAKLDRANGTFTSKINVVLPQPGSLKMIIDPSDLRLYRMAAELPPSHKGHLTQAQFYKAVYGIDLRNFATGGFVSGSGGPTSDSIPAMLSNGEFVVKASAVGAYGVDFLNALNQQKVGSFGSSSANLSSAQGSMVAYLSPEDRSLLRAVIDRPVNLYTENAKIASSANAGNVVLAQRGTN
jgi:TP901 family phage tail tape measure protein